MFLDNGDESVNILQTPSTFCWKIRLKNCGIMNGSEKLYSLCSPRHFLLVSFSIFFSIFPFIPYISPRRFPKHAQAMKRLRFAGKALGKCASDITFFLFSKWKMFLDAEFFANNLWP